MTERNKKENYIIDTDGDKWTFCPKKKWIYRGSTPVAQAESFEEMINKLLEINYVKPEEVIQPGDMVIVKPCVDVPDEAQKILEVPSLILCIEPDFFVAQMSPAFPGGYHDSDYSKYPGYLRNSCHFGICFNDLELVEIKEKTYYKSPSGFQTNDDNWKDGLNLLWDLERK